MEAGVARCAHQHHERVRDLACAVHLDREVEARRFHALEEARDRVEVAFGCGSSDFAQVRQPDEGDLGLRIGGVECAQRGDGAKQARQSERAEKRDAHAPSGARRIPGTGMGFA
jgi:hypothetical protein